MRRSFLLLGFSAALMLAGCGSPAEPTTAHYKPVSHWVEALKSPDIALRKQAAHVLGNVGPNDPAVVPALIEALKDAEAVVRIEAVIGLMKIGPAAEDAIPALEEARNDKDPKMREYVLKALERIRS
jgi:HEAT repeat protein